MQRSLQPLQAAPGFDLRLIWVVTATGRLSVKLRFLSVSSVAVIVLFLAIPAFANIVACASSNLSTIDGTTCDIGNLQFTFTGLQSANTNGIVWTDSDFFFTALSNGFVLSGPPAQTLTNTGDSEAVNYAQLTYNVTDLSDAITGVGVFGGNPAVSGPDTSFPATSFAIYADLLSCGNSLECPTGSPQVLYALNENYDDAGTIRTSQGSVNFYGGSIISGSGVAEVFALIAQPGDTAGIDSTTTAFTFTTGPYVPPPPIPEPRLVTLLCIGVLGLVCATRVRLPR